MGYGCAGQQRQRAGPLPGGGRPALFPAVCVRVSGGTAMRPVLATPATSTAPPRPLVLVADDETLLHPLYRLHLARAGLDVLLATSGEEAVRLYREHRRDIAVVLLDVMMPGLGGLGALRAIRALNPLA